MANVYLALKRSVGFVLLLLCQAAIAQPVINSFSPTSAWPGTPVTISGSGFSAVAGDNIVYFGPVRATVQLASASTLNVTVPVGATYAPITVTVNGLTGYSQLLFNVGFQNSDSTLDSTDFGARRDILGINTPRSITPADLDGDGRTDLFVTNPAYNNNNVHVLRNTSTPQTVSFAANKVFPAATSPWGSAAGDLDGDGKVDIAVANSLSASSGSVTVYRNSSINDTIVFDTTMYATASLSQRVAINDIDGDGKPDMLVTSNNARIISVFRNTTTTPGHITFAPKIDLTTGPGPRDLEVADIDGDGKPDLVSVAAGVTPSIGYGISLWRNQSTPGAISFSSMVHISTVVGPTAVKVGDLNNDGKLDIVVASFNGGNISFFRNTSTIGNFSFDTRQDITTGGRPQRLTIGDVNGDGRPDVAVCFDTARAIYVFPGIAGDSIKLGNRVRFKAGVLAGDIAIGDIDGDGEADLTFCHSEGVFGNPVTVLRNKPNSQLPIITSFTPTSAGKGTIVNIFGKNFSTPAGVRFGNYWSDSVRVVSDSVVQARVGNGATGDVTLHTLYGVASKPGFTYIVDTTCPVIKSFSPSVGQQGTAVYITGSKFTGSTGVRFGGVPADSMVVINDTLIKAIVDTGASGSVQVFKLNCVASTSGFTYIPGSTSPVISYFTPSNGTLGTQVSIYGSRFTNASAVRFGGVLADSIILISDTLIKAIVGSGATGNVSVTTPYGTVSAPGFIYTLCPLITNFWPTSGTKGTAVYILGSNFNSTSAVRFGGVLADSIVIMSDTMIKAIVDTGATGSVQVISPYCSASKPGFTYISDTTINDTLFVNARTENANGVIQRSFKLYPNPATKYVTWQQPVTSHKTRLQLVDMAGRIVRQMEVGSNTPQTTIRLHGLMAGVYKLVYIDGKNKITSTLLIK